MKKINPYRYLLLLALLAATATVSAQNKRNISARDSAVKDTAALAKMATDLGITKQKARQLNTVMNYKHNELEQIMKNPATDAVHKQGYLKRIMLQRHYKLDSMLTPAQKMSFLQHEANSRQKETSAQAAMLSRHEAEMNQVPHQRAIIRDTLKSKKN
jgi:hypothetical protein